MIHYVSSYIYLPFQTAQLRFFAILLLSTILSLTLTVSHCTIRSTKSLFSCYKATHLVIIFLVVLNVRLNYTTKLVQILNYSATLHPICAIPCFIFNKQWNSFLNVHCWLVQCLHSVHWSWCWQMVMVALAVTVQRCLPHITNVLYVRLVVALVFEWIKSFFKVNFFNFLSQCVYLS